MTQKQSVKFIFKDPEFWAILAFNVFILVSYFVDAASAKTVVVLFLIQSLFIGVQTFIRMIACGLALPPKTSLSNRFGTPIFFAIHYGIFHLVYCIFVFVIVVGMPGKFDFNLLRGTMLFIIGNTLVSLVSDIKRDRINETQANGIMFQPYFRILPMHFFIIIGFNTGADGVSQAFYIFIALKTVADLLMHVVVNGTYIERRPQAVEGWI